MNRQHDFQRFIKSVVLFFQPVSNSLWAHCSIMICLLLAGGGTLPVHAQAPTPKSVKGGSGNDVSGFKKLDADDDQLLSLEEYLVSVAKKDHPQFTRNFKIFDQNDDQKLTFDEYQNLISPSQRKLTHPIAERVAQRLQKLQADWSKYDTNSDGKLDESEFKASKLTATIPGLSSSKLEDWDRNADGSVDLKDVEQALEIAYGLRYPTGELLWEPSGRMLTGMLFAYVDKNKDYSINLDEAKQAKFGFLDGKQTPALFKKWDQDGDGKLTMAEWKAEPTHWRDPVGIFLASDKNYDGLLDQEEHVAGAESWTKEVSAYLLKGFDLDGDQRLSLREYRQTPFANLAREWHSLRSDRDQDGTLNLAEFSWGKDLFAATLTPEYFQRLDLNQDGKLDQKEFTFNTTNRDPEYYTIEFQKIDADKNGQLTPTEFLGKRKDAQRQQARRSFYDWDSNADQQLSLAEFTQRQKPKQAVPVNEFRYLDADDDQALTGKEFLASVVKKDHPQFIRNFKIFDENQDQHLTFTEYQNIVSPSQRKLGHPIAERVAQRLQKLKADWNKYDTNSDGQLDESEFKASKLTATIPGLSSSKWEDWDRNADGSVDLKDVEQALEIAYGLRHPTGELLWEPMGRVLSGMLFDHVDRNGDHLIDLAEAKLTQHGFRDGKQTPALFKKWDQDGDGKLTMAEWKVEPSHWTDPVGNFMGADKDLDGHLSQDELLKTTPEWQLSVTQYLFPGFDTDKDQRLSLNEYRQTPFANLARPWQNRRTDRDQDGALNLAEFNWGKGLLAASLTVEYFQKLDLNQDGKLNLKEFSFNTTRRDPEYYTIEFQKIDADKNGQLTPTEFLEKRKGAQRQQARRSFYDWDSNADQQLSLAEFTQRQKPKQAVPVNEFRYLDADDDQALTGKEYLASVAEKDHPQFTRNFKIFDQNDDQKLTFDEYQNLISPSQRKLGHPIAERVAQQLQKLKADWNKYDTNGDGQLDESEFKASKLTATIPGLSSSKLEDWDRNADGSVDLKDVEQALEIAYGLRYPTGELLWEPSGRMLTGMLFAYVDKNKDYSINLDEAKQAQFGFLDGKQTPALFKKWDKDGNGKLTMAEWKAEPTHWRDPVGIFLASDKNYDGLLDQEEHVAGAESWTKEVSAYLLKGFDLDGDQRLSLREYRQTPFANLAREWHSLRSDRDQDGTLNLAEFSWGKDLFAATLTPEYFQRLDLNQDGKLDQKEFTFNTTNRDPEYYTIEFQKIDADKNGQLTPTEFLGKRKDAQRQQARRSFYDWDSNADQQLSLAEFTQRQKPKQAVPVNEFRYLDADDDQALTGKEFLASVVKKDHPQFIRNFKIFDENQDQHLTFTEYQNIVSPSQRKLGHPIAERVAQRLQKLKADWNKYDTNSDGQLDESEFKASKLTATIPGLSSSKWEDWDRNADGSVDLKDVEQALEIAYGLRHPTGELLWEPMGRVLSGMLFDHVDRNGDHLIDLAEAKLTQHGFRDGKQTPALFKKWDQDGDGKLTMAEWKVEPSHWTDPVGNFMGADKDLDGHLSQDELLKTTPEWQLSVTQYLFPGFDTDKDQRLSLNEYRQTPFANLARPWQNRRTDRDQDGALNLAEFNWGKGLLAASLTVEYFQKLDLNQDGKLNLKEFSFNTTRRDPEYYTIEFQKIDADKNGQLTPTEFLEKRKGAQRQQARRSFYDWDSNADQQLSLAEFTQRQKPKQAVPVNEFRYLDADDDQALTGKEYLASVAEKDHPQFTRNFKIFDQNDDQKLTFDEYQNLISPSQRKLGHPIAERVAQQLQKLKADWNKYDTNGDGQLDESEFKASKLTATIPGLSSSKLEDWDRNADGSVDLKDAEQALEIAYGLRYPTGELLWEPSGRMVTGMLYDYVDKNKNHSVDLEEAKQAQFGFLDGKQTPALFKKWDQDGDGKLTMAEWKVEPSHWTDPVGIFLSTDKDLDGYLSQDELLKNTPEWQLSVTQYLFPGFDLDGDQRLSLREYRQTPFSNMARPWQYQRVDRNQDGTLNLAEFGWGEELLAAALALEYFERLDLNQDGKLELKEYSFQTTKRDPEYYTLEFQKIDADKNGQLTLTEFIGKRQNTQRQQARRSFYDWDSNTDQQLSLAEFTQRQKPKQVIPENEFRFRDADDDQALTGKEYLASVAEKDHPQFMRNFKIFDQDDDQKLTLAEYQNLISPSQRKLTHPIAERVAQQSQKLQADWNKYDSNSDGKLDEAEFSASGLARSVPGLALTVWEDWDRNADGFIDPEDVEQVLEIAYGLRYPTGELLWEPSGRMVTGMLYAYVDKNKNHSIDLEEAKQAKFGFLDGKQTPALFKKWDQDGDGKLTMAEWKAEPTHWRDPVGIFLASDKNYDGLLDQGEHVAGAESWTKEVSAYLLKGFDLDGDQRLSLNEYRQTPFANLAREWQSLRSDRNKDGVLNLSEFSWGEGLLAATLTLEYFERLDLNQDGKLDQQEFIFRLAPSKASLGTMFTQRDLDQNDTLTFEEYLGNHKLPPDANEKQVIYYETRLARFEDAFRKADVNGDNQLDEPEFRSEPSLEVIAPDLVQKKKNRSSLTVGKTDDSEAADSDSEIWIVLSLNGLLLLGAIVFVLRKSNKSTHS